jgi:hypothetical protein
MSFRDAAGTQIDWRDTGLEETAFSNFLFIDQRYFSDPVLRRIFSIARKHKYKSLLIDTIDEGSCPLLHQENEAIRTRKPAFLKSEVHRLSFFRTPKNQAPQPGDFLGYVVFKQDFFQGEPAPRTHIYESVMLPPRGPSQNNFLHCQRSFPVRTSLGDFSITGTLYAQQNDLTFVCAHVALRSVLAAFLPQGDFTYPEMNALLGIDHTTRRMGDKAGGLEPEDIEAVFRHLHIEFDKFVHEPDEKLFLATDFQRDLYGFIESGCPALVGFELSDPDPRRHIIPVFGHTFNEDAWVPGAQRAYFGDKLSYYPSESWLSTFVIHDDNFGPYFCLPRHFLQVHSPQSVSRLLRPFARKFPRKFFRKDNFRLLYGLKSQSLAYGSVDAEALGFAFFSSIANNVGTTGVDWYDRFAIFTRCEWLVLRTLLLSRDRYLDHLRAIRDRKKAKVEDALLHSLRAILPTNFWMVEASAPELYTVSRRKFGEVLLSPTKHRTEPLTSLVLAARLPGVVSFGGATLTNEPSAVEGHTPIFGFPTV